MKLFTWTPLWFYWPAYLALARCELGHSARLTAIKLMCDLPTDKAIRDQFYQSVNNGDDALAICEPGELFHPISNALIHRIPIAWRLPQWLYWKGQLGDVRTIHSLPEKSTSGDYARQMVRILPSLDNEKITFVDTDGTLDKDRKALNYISASSGVCLASFTPWHNFESLTGDIKHRLLPGPKCEVTSLLYVDHINQNMATLSKDFCAEFKLVLTELTDTHGDFDLLTTFVTQNASKVDAFLVKAGKPWTLDVPFLVKALSEYVLMGSYFPYFAMDMALSSEIRRNVHQHLNDLSAKVIENVHTDIRSFLGINAHWRDMNFIDRINTWNHITSNHPNNLSPATMWAHQDDPLNQQLLTRPVPVGLNQGLVGIGNLASDAPTTCPFGAQNVLACRKLKAADTESIIRDACAPCMLSGTPNGLVKTAAKRLKQYAISANKPLAKLTIESVEVRSKDGLKPSVFGGTCPVAASDIDDMLKTFAVESRAKGNEGEACQTILYNGYHEVEKSGDVVFAIYWRGDTTTGSSGGDSGQAEAGLLRMTKRNADAGRRVAWTGMWKRNENDVTGNTAAGWLEFEKVPMLSRAKAHFMDERFDFAYVVAFRFERSGP